MKLTVRQSVICAVLLGILLPAAIGAGVLALSFYTQKIDQDIERDLTRQAEVIALSMRENLWGIDRESARTLIGAFMTAPDVVSIEVRDANAEQFVYDQNISRRQGKIHSRIQAVFGHGKKMGEIELALSETPARTNLNQQLLSAASVLGLQLVGSALLILFVLHRRIGKPLERLGEKAARLASGELELPISIAREDEIGQVERELETTRTALQGLLKTLEHKNQVLEFDLQERFRVESILRDREQRLGTLVEQSPLAVIELDLNWHILGWNDAAVNIFGWRREDILGREINALLPPGVAESLSPFIQKFDQTPATKPHEILCLRSDKAHISCQWHIRHILNAVGVPQRIVVIADDVTERKRADDEIRKLASALSLATNLIALTNTEGVIEWGNHAFEALFALSSRRQRKLGSVLKSRLRNEISATTEYISQAIREGHKISGLELPLHNDGSHLPSWLSLDLEPLLNEEGQVTQWIAILTDITERHATAEALRRIAQIDAHHSLNDFFTNLLQILTQGVGAQGAYLALHQPDGYCIEAVQVPAEWMIVPGHYAWDSAQAQVSEQHGPAIIRQPAPGLTQRHPALLNCAGIESLVIEPIQDTARHPLGHIALLFKRPVQSVDSIQSILAIGAARAAAETLRHNTLQALRYSEQKFFSLFQHSPIALALLDEPNGVCLDLNPAFQTQFGYPPEALIGRPLIESPIYVDPQQRTQIRELLGRDGHASQVELKVRTASGETRQCYVHARLVSAENGHWILAAVIDVTELLNAQHEIEQLNASLEQRVVERTQALANTNTELELALNHLQRTQDELIRSEKFAALGALVAGIAHELNTPIGNSLLVASTLNEVTGSFQQSMASGLKKSVLESYVAETQVASDILIRNLGRAAELITSFKQVAVDQTSSQRRKFDLAEVADEIILTMSPVFRRTPYVVENLIPANTWLDSYPGPLGQVIANLLNNALLHAFEQRKHGRVTLSILQEDPHHLLLCCKDDGTGISPDNIERIFDPFFSTRREKDGTGLGLNIVQNIVSGVLGGDIHVDSTLGKGSCFKLHLPKIAPQAKPKDKQDQAGLPDSLSLSLWQKSS